MSTTNPLALYGLTVTQGMTTPSKPGKAPRPVWEVSGLTAGYEDLFYSLGGKKWRGKFSFWEDPTAALLEELPNTQRATLTERQEAKVARAEERADRYAERAQAAEGRSQTLYGQAREMAEGIPFGQPILVGHHSEKRDRNYRERICNRFEKSFEEQKKAEYYRGKAGGAQRTAAPKSLAFMQRRLEEAKASLRDVERKLEQARAGGHVEWEARLLLRQSEEQKAITYWEEQIAAAGGVHYSKENVKVGDLIMRAKRGGSVHVVTRVNPKSVSVEEKIGGYTWKHTIPYAEIKDLIGQDHEKYAEYRAILEGKTEEAA